MKRLAILLVLTAYALAASAQTDSTIPNLGVEKHTLANGLEVLLIEEHRIPRVAVCVWYHVGPMNEPPGRTGFAHLFEHMMFQRSKHVPEDQYFRMLEAAGANDINGTTDFDRTNYFETVPTNQLELALWMESDRMGYMLDVVDPESLRNQKDVVRNERRQSTENTPFGVVEEAMVQAIFPAGHPYHGFVIGSHADIQAVKFEDVKSFSKQFYTPNNASIAIVGDINKAETLKLVEKYFGSLKRGPDVQPVQIATPQITAEKRLVVRDRVEVPRLYMAWLAPAIFKPGDAEGHIAADILGGGKSSRLYKSLVYEKKIAQDVYADVWRYGLGTVFVITATPLAGHTLDELEKEIDAQLESMRQSEPQTAEVDRAKASIESSILFSLERLGNYNGTADRINLYNHYLKDPNYLARDVQRYRRVGAADVRQFVVNTLARNSRVVVQGVPGAPEPGPEIPTSPIAEAGTPESVNADEPWRSAPPAPGPAPKIALPPPESFKLPNGLTVILESRKGVPVVAANLVVRSGTGSNPADKPGLANFTLDMLEEGTASRSALKFADDLAQIGARYRTRIAGDSSSVTVNLIKRNAAAGFDLLADVVMNPAFPQAELDRERQSRLGLLLEAKQDAGQVANSVLALSLFGPQNSFGHSDLGTEASVRRISRNDMRSFWSQNFVPRNAALVVSGDITRAELEPILARSFVRWRGGNARRPARREPVTTKANVVIVDKPGAPQSQLRVAMFGPTRSTADYEQLQVMNAILGGMFSSRINLNLRERNGYSYGANSRFTYLREAGWFSSGGGVRTDVTDAATREVLREIGRMAETPVTTDELSLAKEFLVGTLPGRFELTDQTVTLLTDLYVYDLGMAYYNQYAGKVTGATVDAIQSVAKKYLTAQKPLVVVVGDRAKIEEGMKQFGVVEIKKPDSN